ncbi:MAG: peptidoglycan recognition family protein [Lachnospiraceae bacterium]|nr:peptidoglycan recognition family protein [Lachnospiraceae bacterium]
MHREDDERRPEKNSRDGLFRFMQILVAVTALILVGLIILNHVRSGRSFSLKPGLFHSGEESPSGSAKAEEADGTHDAEFWEGAPDIDVQLLTVNEYSRPGIAMNEVNGIVIHYTANPGSTAQGNHDYFEGLKDGGGEKASSHFIVGLKGEIIQCIPSTEIAYASNDRNTDTISVECCHPDDTGEFTTETYNATVELTAWLCKAFDVDPDNVIRHYDITGKECPKYYVDNPEEWTMLKGFIKQRYEELVS